MSYKIVACKICSKRFKQSLKHRVYCSIKCNKAGQVIVRHNWYLEHKDEVLKRGKYCPHIAQINRKSVLKREYGLTIEKYNQIALEQHGCCAICKQPVKLNVDHNHKTGKVRGLLCRKCNSILGYADDNSKILQNAIKYLRRK